MWWDTPADTFVDLKVYSRIFSMASLSPLLASAKLKLYYFFHPYRLYLPELRKNKIMPMNTFPEVDFPKIKFNSVDYGKQGDNVDDLIIPANIHNAAVLPGSLLSRLGYARGDAQTNNALEVGMSSNDLMQANSIGDWQAVGSSVVNAIPLLAYWDEYLSYIVDPQDKNIPIYTEVIGKDSDGVYINRKREFVNYDALANLPYVTGFSENISNYGNGGMTYFPGDRTFNIQPTTLGQSTSYDLGLWDENTYSKTKYGIVTQLNNPNSLYNYDEDSELYFIDSKVSHCNSVAGLLPTRYSPDYFTTWYDQAQLQNITSIAIGQNTTIESLRLQHRNYVQRMIEMVTGGRFYDFIGYKYGVELPKGDQPILVGTDTITFGFNDITITSDTNDGSEVGDANRTPGMKVSFADRAEKSNKNVRFRTLEPGLLMVCATLIPEVDYSQGVNRFLDKMKFGDLYDPAFDAVGFQQIRAREVFATRLGLPIDQNGVVRPDNNESVGIMDVPVFYEYENEVGRIDGLLLANEDFRSWTFNRRYDPYVNGARASRDNFSSIIPLLKSKYITPEMFNYNFVNVGQNTDNTSNELVGEADNFVFQHFFECRMKQPKSKLLIKTTL